MTGATSERPKRSASPAATARQLARAFRRPWLWLHALLVFACLAALAHLIVVLLLPRYAVQDSASLLLSTGAEGRAELLSRDRESVRVLDADPMTAIGACGFDLEDGPTRISVRAGAVPLAISVHMRGGMVAYAVTDRAAQRGIIEFVLLNETQFEARVAADDDGEGTRELRVVVNGRQGVVIARALMRQPSDRPIAEALASGMACGLAG